jgi:hypothetical protein
MRRRRAGKVERKQQRARAADRYLRPIAGGRK